MSGDPYPKSSQFARGTRRAFRARANRAEWERITALKIGPCRVCVLPASNGHGFPRVQMHHLVHRSQGGDDVPENIVPLCLACHDDVHAGALRLAQRLREDTQRVGARVRHPEAWGAAAVTREPEPWCDALRVRLRLWWRKNFPLRQLPYRICVPWQPVAPDGPYKAWRWFGREWLKRPWPEGRTKETYMKYRAMEARTSHSHPVTRP